MTTNKTSTRSFRAIWLCIALICQAAAFNVGTTSSKTRSTSSLYSTTPSDFNSRKNFIRSLMVTSGAALLQPFPATAANVGGKVQFGEESIMSQKEHGTSAVPVQNDLLYGVSNKLADKICNYNRHFAENGGYFLKTSFEDVMLEAKGPVTFFDSNTGKPLFEAPIGRSVDDFLRESEVHGWPSFRDEEVVWDNVRVLKTSGETVSLDGTHLGHNLPDRKGNRYCINLVSVAGQAV